MNSNDEKNVIYIDSIKRRIRIHKSTLHELGDPSYIELLINPDEKKLAIKSVSHPTQLSHEVNLEKNKKNCYELYSSILIANIYKIVPELCFNKSFYLYGECNKNVGIAHFNLNDAIVAKNMVI